MDRKHGFLVLLFVVAMVPVIAVMMAVVISIWSTSPGGQKQAALFEILSLSEGVSSRWCEAMRVSIDGGLLSARLVSSPPQPIPNSRMTLTSNNTAVIPYKQYVGWRYYAANNSNLKIEDCATETGILGFIFRTETVDKRCIRESVDPEVKDLCNSITVARNLLRICRPSKHVIELPVVEQNYYHMIYLSLKTEAEVRSTVTLQQPEINWKNSEFNCTLQPSCSVPLTYLMQKIVTVQIEEGSDTDPKVTWHCVPRKTIIVIAFFTTVGGVILILTAVILLIRMKWTQKYDEIFADADHNSRLLRTNRRTELYPIPIRLSPASTHEDLTNESL